MRIRHDELERDGFQIVSGAVEESAISALAEAMTQVADGEHVRRRGSVYGIRNLLDAAPTVRALAHSEEIGSLVGPVLGPCAFPVRGILFDKTAEANWNVVWHQDLSIAVRERRDVAGFGPWSEKAGVTHVQPPAEVLERMLTVRLHLDDCDEDNGPLRVIPGSHRSDRLDAQAIQQWRQRVPDVACLVPKGGVLLMRPLLLHASSPARTPRRRRVIHLEFASGELPGGLHWYETQGAQA